jgi:hypothetical protein
MIFGGNFQISVRFLLKVCKIFLRIQKTNVYPVYKPAAVDYIMFNFCEFLSISNFVLRAFIKESSHVWSKKR